MLDYEGKNSFTLLITATDLTNSARTATTEVTVNLVNQNEAPYFDKDSRDKVQNVAADTGAVTPKTIMYAENRRTEVVAIAAIEPDGDSLRWELTGDDAGDFMIEDISDGSGTRDRVKLVFRDQPDYENGKGSATSTGGAPGDTYNVTVRAAEEMDSVGGGPAKAAELDVMVTIDDIDETGSVEVKWLQPEVETPQETIVTDPDVTPGRITAVTRTSGSGRRLLTPTVNLTSDDIENLGAADSEWETITGDGNPTTADLHAAG